MDGTWLCGLITGGFIPVQKVRCDSDIFLLDFEQYRKQSQEHKYSWYDFVMVTLEGQRHGNPYDVMHPYIGLQNTNVIGGLFSPERNEKINESLLSDPLCDDWELYTSTLENL